MKQQGFGPYRGRKSFGRQILTVIAVILAIALVLAVLAAIILPNYIEYTPDGPRVVLPFFGWTKPAGENPYSTPAPSPSPSDDFIVVVEAPTSSPEPTPTPTPKFSMTPRRKPLRGLTPVTAEEVKAGGVSLAADRGAFVDVSGVDLTDETLRTGLLELPYAAAYLKPGWNKCSEEDTAEQFEKDLKAKLEALARAGFDEIVLSRPNLKKVDPKASAKAYTIARETLDTLGYKGRLSIVCGRDVFTDEDLGKAQLASIAKSFDRIYAAAGENWSGISIRKTLTADGREFKGGYSDIITVTKNPQANAKFSWAVLP